MDCREAKKMALIQALGIDRRIFYLCLLTWFLASLSYAAWIGIDGQGKFGQSFERLPAMVAAGVYWGFLLSPILVPSMLVGWVLGWTVGALVKLPPIARALLAATILGTGPASLFYYFFGYDPHPVYGEGHWRILVQPALWILPTTALMAGLVIYVPRRSP